jgi:riboflavin kinase/FMN adenylyltransferase
MELTGALSTESESPSKSVLENQGPARPQMLDPPVTVCGIVVHGAQIGRTLGVPTANLRVGAELGHLSFGVYAGQALDRPAAISLGVRPTFGDDLEPLLEAHILDFDGDLYGQQLVVELLAYLRGEVRFASVDDLRRQMASDLDSAREVWTRCAR